MEPADPASGQHFPTHTAFLLWKSWTSWNKQASESVDRSYDYPHVAAAYWVLYRLARDHMGLVTNHSWDWYLDHAYQTSIAMTTYAKDLSVFGQMEGSIFVQILADLKREGMNKQAANRPIKRRRRIAGVCPTLLYSAEPVPS